MKEVIRGTWTTIPVGKAQIFAGFRAACELPMVRPWSELGRYELRKSRIDNAL